MNIKSLIPVFLTGALFSCSSPEDYTKYVNPFVGAADNGHCMPGACIPFGLIQAGPQSGNCIIVTYKDL